MSNVIYCTYCNKFWKGIIEYEEHKPTVCKQPSEMSKQRSSKKQLHEILEDLTKRLERAENEISRLRGIVQTKNRKVIHDWLNQTNQTPKMSFDNWRKDIQVNSNDVEKMMSGSISGGLTEGVISCVNYHVERTDSGKPLPIRCFAQKPKTFYTYSPDDSGNLGWRIMRNENETLGLMMDSVERKLRRKYNAEKIDSASDEEEEDLDKHQMIMDKINGTKTSPEKRIAIFKKWLFSKLEENLTVLMECEFV